MMARAAIAAVAGTLMVEVHDDPDPPERKGDRVTMVGHVAAIEGAAARGGRERGSASPDR
jgi:hypothetical protein